MPDTPVYSITYPCEGSPVSVADFATFATDVEAAISTVSTVANGVTHRPYVRGNWTSNAAVAVETIVVFSAASTSSTGITVNAAAGTATIGTAGIYRIGANLSNGTQSDTTMSSQRLSVFRNGVFYAGKRFRGRNPISIDCAGGSYTILMNLAAGDVITFRYLWTGTGSIVASGGASGSFDVSMLFTP